MGLLNPRKTIKRHSNWRLARRIYQVIAISFHPSKTHYLNYLGEHMKHNKHIYKLSSVIALVLSVHSLPAISTSSEDSTGAGAIIKIGTLGPGVEFDYRLNESWNIRLQANGYSYSDTFEEDDIDYTGEIKLSSFGALIDWRPFSGTFRMSGGLYSNGNELEGTAISRGDEIFEIGDLTYQGVAAAPLTLNTSVKLGRSSAGYLGLGWGNSANSGWLFSFEMGVLFSGSPEVELGFEGFAEQENNPGTIFDVNGNSPEALTFQNEIALEVKNLEDDISDFEYYPVISLGVGYRF